MKKTLCVLFVIFALFSLSAMYNFGYGVGVAGSSEGKTAVDLNFTYRPFDLSYCNPFITVEGGCSFDSDEFGFDEIKAFAGAEVFKSTFNPLGFTTVNKSMWSPSAGCGVSYRNKDFSLYVEACPLRVLDKDFIYEYFTVGLNLKEFKIDDWRVYLFRFTSML